MPITSVLAAGILVGSFVLLLARPSRVPDWAAYLRALCFGDDRRSAAGRGAPFAGRLLEVFLFFLDWACRR